MKRISGRWRLGITLASISALMWAILPVVLQILLQTVDFQTITLFRYFLPAIILTPYLFLNGTLNNFSEKLTSKHVIILITSGVLLAGNYGFYILGLAKTSADSAQVMIQLAPISLLLAGIYIFKEPFSKSQWLGFVVFATGLFLFFYHRITHHLADLGTYGAGLSIVSLSALCFTGYAIALKYLLRTFTAQEAMMIFYWIGSILFLPFSDLPGLLSLKKFELLLLLFCGINTLITYSCFSEAFAHVEMSRVSAVVATTPLLTIGFVQLAAPLFNLNAEPITLLSLCGAALVVTGSITTAIAKRHPMSD